MSDIRPQIPSFAFIEMQILQNAYQTDALLPSVWRVEEDYGLEKGSLGTGGFQELRVITLLYCLIVVPKEIWSLDRNHEIYDKIDQTWLSSTFTVMKCRNSFSENSVYNTIHCLRNAVAHANFSAEKGQYQFWDKDPRTSTEHTRLSTDVEKLQDFLSQTGAMLANLRKNV